MGLVPFVLTIWRIIDHLFMQCSFIEAIWSTIARYCPIPVNTDLYFLVLLDSIWKHENNYNKLYHRSLENSLLLLGRFELI